MISTELVLRTLGAVLVLIAVATTILLVARVRQPWGPALAVLRGMLQLAAISLILTGVITHPVIVAAALLVMFTVAVVTSTRRLGWSTRLLWLTAAGMGTGVVVSLSVAFATGAIGLTPRYALAIGGIVIGGSMSSATLAGRRVTQAVNDRWDEVEGWLALGATSRQATVDLARHGLREALIPSIDQTRTTGLVTLPGAFVGAIFGGIAPLEAGRFQLVVLASLMATAAVTSAVVSFGLAPGVRKGDLRGQ